MSCLNLAGTLLTPDYATLYLVDSDIMAEARKRGGKFEGIVGKTMTDKSRATENGRGRITARFKFRDRSRSRSRGSKPSSAARSEPPTANEVELIGRDRERTFKIHRSNSTVHGPQLTVSGHHPFTLHPKATHRVLLLKWILPILSVLVSSISVVVNWSFSRFERRNSSYAQQVWVLAWLINGILVGLAIGLLPPPAWYSSDRKRITVLACQMACATGAIGGMVVVVQMLFEYGVCWQLY